MVLRSMPKPAWLSEDAPHGDVVLSSRTRVMRNLRGHRFPNRADTAELQEVMRKVLAAADPLELEAHKALTNAERDYLVGCRLLSPDFEWTQPGRALLLSGDRSISVMVNEEDHLRIQAISAGWSVENSDSLALHWLDRLARQLEFAGSPRYGFLAASPTNLGDGRRRSAMFHLIGLAHARRLPAVIKALLARGIVVRGLFGEASRAIGAFAQVSVLRATHEEFAGACEYLLREEREARAAVGRDELREKALQARDFGAASRGVGLADALRILAWVRWAASAEIEGFAVSPREIDAVLTALEIRGTVPEDQAARERATYLRSILGI